MALKEASNLVKGIGQVEFTFLGTSSAIPTLKRNVTSAVLRADQDVMLFDCGEGTQHQLLRGQIVKQGRIKRVFITHVHGDHLFGLPGLVTGLCGVKKDIVRQEEAKESSSSNPPEKLRIYGPRGISMFINVALRVSRMKIPREFVIHELVETRQEAEELSRATGVPLHDWRNEGLRDTLVAPEEVVDVVGNNNNNSNRGGGGVKTWNLCDNGNFNVRAGRLEHTVPCWGYVWTERDQVGRLDMEKLMRTSLGGRAAGPWLAQLKRGETVDGVTRDQVCGPSLQGRKVVVLGDTCDSSGIAHLAQSCDLLVHEVTMLDAMQSKARKRGHSTPTMAGKFARDIRAYELAITHFGGEISANLDNKALTEAAASIKKTFGKGPIIARDFLKIQVQRKRAVVVTEDSGVPPSSDKDDGFVSALDVEGDGEKD